MIPLVVSTAIIVAGWAMIKAGGWAAANPTIIAVVLFTLGVIWLHFWHRRRMAEINELEYKKLGRFKPVSVFSRWPKTCQWCGGAVHSPKALRIHNDENSPCSMIVLAADRRQLAEQLAADQAAHAPEVEAPESARWTATVMADDQAAIDTFTDDTAAIGGSQHE